MIARRAPLICLAIVLGCNDGTVAVTELAGDWTSGMVPSGAFTELYLATASHTVSGTARWQQGMSDGVLVPYSVTGHATAGRFVLTLTPASGSVATFAGSLTAPDRLTGTWTEAGSSRTRTFVRFEP